MCTCVSPVPDVIAIGSPTVLIGGVSAARLFDPTLHGGSIVFGAATVLIGEFAAVGAVTVFPGQRSCLESRIGRYFLQKAANNCFDGFNSFLIPRWYPRNLPQKRGPVSSAPFQWLNSCEK